MIDLPDFPIRATMKFDPPTPSQCVAADAKREAYLRDVAIAAMPTVIRNTQGSPYGYPDLARMAYELASAMWAEHQRAVKETTS